MRSAGGQPKRGCFYVVGALQATPVKQKNPQQPLAMTVADRKLRFLCLHGYLQNAEVQFRGLNWMHLQGA